MRLKGAFIVLAVVALILPSAVRVAAQPDDEEENPAVLTPRGGHAVSGTGAGQGEEDPAPTANPQTTQQLVGGVLAQTATARDPSAPTPCYDKMPTNIKLRGKGRLICWVAHIAPETPEAETGSGETSTTAAPPASAGGRPLGGANNTGTTQGDRALANPVQYTLKHVMQWEDGAFPTGEWYENAKRAWRGASLKFADVTGDRNILNQSITGYKSYVTKFFDPGVGAYVDNSAPSPVPDEAHWTIEISGGYRWTFDHGNSRDCIYSGNGISTLSGNGHSINLPAQQDGEFRYKGWPVCLRCDANVEGRVGGDDSTTTTTTTTAEP